MRALDTYYALKLVGLISKPFTKWKAYKLGVIDANGDVISDPLTRTQQQKASFTKFHVIAKNLRKVISKAPAGRPLLNSGIALMSLTEVQTLVGIEDADEFNAYVDTQLKEAAVAGDSAGDPEAIASGERPNGSAVLNVVPPKDRKKHKKDEKMLTR